MVVPALAPAATYKCSTAGQTTYQQQPCGADAQAVAIEPSGRAVPRSTAATPPPNAPSAPSAPAAALASSTPAGPASTPQRPAAAAMDPAGREAFAREAFRLLKTDTVQLKPLLCPNSGFLDPAHKELLKQQSDYMARQWIEIGPVLRHERTGVVFSTTHRSANGPGGVKRVPNPQPLSVRLGQDRQGRVCVSGIGSKPS
jgi:hypothetical protein